MIKFLAEAKNHPALWEKIIAAIDSLPEGSSNANREEVIFAALIQWLEDRRP